MTKIGALFVEKDGIYFNDKRIDPWDIERNALECKSGALAICHPPCKRWGRYWPGGPSVKIRKLKGDDGGCFAFSLWYVRTFGGVIEHPEASWAWKWFGLNKPPKNGGWVEADEFGGVTCCVEQGHYGHRSRKATWLYVNKVKPIELIWGKAENKLPMEDSFRRNKDRYIERRKNKTPRQGISKRERLETPEAFKELLIKLVKGK